MAVTALHIHSDWPHRTITIALADNCCYNPNNLTDYDVTGMKILTDWLRAFRQRQPGLLSDVGPRGREGLGLQAQAPTFIFSTNEKQPSARADSKRARAR